MAGRLNDRVAIVTGGTSGIGAAIAGRFAAEGAKVVLTGRDASRGEAVADSIRKDGHVADFIASDLTDEVSIQALVGNCVQRYGRLEVLVTSGAATATNTGEREISVTNLDNEILERSVKTNVHGLLWTFKYALPYLIEAASPEDDLTSAVVTIGTAGTRNGTPGMPAYWASKAPVEVMTRSLAREFGGRGVRVNCVLSGLVLTESERGAMSDEFRDYVLGLNSVPYLGRPDDIAAACTFLSSHEARYVTGATLAVDGGASM
ncbi:SDR family oxidoreductase [Myxococcota bacterium]|nr:SDR family oxidoreductase [Myxococcota bacterium]